MSELFRLVTRSGYSPSVHSNTVNLNRNSRVALNAGNGAGGLGRLKIELTSRSEGAVCFSSDVPENGSGQFTIQRLAQVK